MSLKKTLAKKALWSGAAVERLLRGRRFRVPGNEVRSVLVLEYMLPLGCCVHMTPVYEAVRESRPDATITVATRGLGAALLRHNPCINHLIETPDPLVNLWGAQKALSGKLAELKVRPECVLTGASDQRTRIGLLGALACRRWRGGFTQAPELYQYALRVDRKRSLIDNNLRLAEMLGCDARHREPRVFFSQTDVVRAKGMIDKANPEGRPLLAMVTQTSGGQRTGWHRNRFVDVLHHAKNVMECAVIYVGTKDDTTAIDGLCATAGGIGISLAGRTSVTQLAAVLAMSDYVVSLDTGPMHVARAVGTPMVVLGPSWQKPIEWMPLGLEQVRVLRGQDQDEVSQAYQLDEVEANDVMIALTELTKTFPAAQEHRDARIERCISSVDHCSDRLTDPRSTLG